MIGDIPGLQRGHEERQPLGEWRWGHDPGERSQSEVRVRVDETWCDRASGEVELLLGRVAGVQFAAQSDGHDPVTLRNDGTVSDRWAVDREYPVGRHEHGR